MCHGFLTCNNADGKRVSQAVGYAFKVFHERVKKCKAAAERTKPTTERKSTFSENRDWSSPTICRNWDYSINNQFAIERPHASPKILERFERQGSLRVANQQSPFKRQMSLRIMDLESNVERTKTFQRSALRTINFNIADKAPISNEKNIISSTVQALGKPNSIYCNVPYTGAQLLSNAPPQIKTTPTAHVLPYRRETFESIDSVRIGKSDITSSRNVVYSNLTILESDAIENLNDLHIYEQDIETNLEASKEIPENGNPFS